MDVVAEQYRDCPKNVILYTTYILIYPITQRLLFFQEFGTPTGTVWISIFANLVNLSNQYFSNLEAHNNSSLLPVAEQIPILHRLGKIGIGATPQTHNISIHLQIIRCIRCASGSPSRQSSFAASGKWTASSRFWSTMSSCA